MRLRPLLILAFALVSSIGLAGGVHAQTPPASPATRVTASLHYAFDAAFHGSVALRRNARGWGLDVREMSFRPGPDVGLWRNEVLLPGRHPLDDRPGQLRSLQLEPDGFTVVVDYPVSNLVESYHLTFEHLKATDPARCPVKLIRYRHEQRLPSGELRGGLVAEFALGIARLLAIEGQPGDTPLLPIRLLPRDTCLTELPSVFEGVAHLDVPKLR